MKKEPRTGLFNASDAKEQDIYNTDALQIPDVWNVISLMRVIFVLKEIATEYLQCKSGLENYTFFNYVGLKFFHRLKKECYSHNNALHAAKSDENFPGVQILR